MQALPKGTSLQGDELTADFGTGRSGGRMSFMKTFFAED
jgi:hypothetical protein